MNVVVPDNVYACIVAPDDYAARTRLALACCDCDSIPKLGGAGGLRQIDGTWYQMMHNGVLVALDGYYGRWMSDIIRNLKGHHEPQEELAFHNVLSAIGPNATMIEAGSYWAYYSAWFQKRIPGARNIMIEPVERNLEVGKQNFQINGFSGDFVNAYVGRKVTNSSESPDQVATTTIDATFERFSLNHVHLLHADVQGAEADMLVGAARAFGEKLIDFVFISTHDDRNLHGLCLRRLEAYGYLILCEHNKIDSFSYDGLIVAQSPALPRLEPITISKRSDFARLYAGTDSPGC